MENYNNILVLGLGISGISTIKLLDKLNKEIYLYDSKDKNSLKINLEEINTISVTKYLGGEIPNLNGIDLVIKSPGMSPDEEVIKKIKDKGIELITDIEFAYRLSKTNNIIAVTGTNGKTTVVTLLNEIFISGGRNVILGGNIGFGILDKILDTKPDDVLLIEASSFQLNDISEFKPKISAITNLGSDHLDWHRTTDDYRNAKRHIYMNQTQDDYIVLDYDNKTLKELSDINARILWCSIDNKLDEGIYIEDETIIIKFDGKINNLMNISEINIFGKHNLKNILYVVGICILMGINIEVIKNTIKEFNGVEHRLEYVKVIKNVKYINDSKGTNLESTIVAIDAFNDPKILIAGGKDEGACFDELVKKISKEVKSVILLGETKELIYEKLLEIGYKNMIKVSSMNEAVSEANKQAIKGDIVLFSPACASYDMYNNYMQRGEDFKREVKLLFEEV